MRTILLVGYGSIGQRYARLLTNLGHQVVLLRIKGCGNELGLKEISNWDQVIAINPEIAFVTNPTNLHIDVVERCMDCGIRSIFLEKPIDMSLKGMDRLLVRITELKATVYVAYVLRFHPVLNALRQLLVEKKLKKLYHVRITNSSYLPDWRPGKGAKETYSAYAEQGGGVILDCSHEFDYIEYLFGPFECLYHRYGRRSAITVDSEDYVEASLMSRELPISLFISYFGKIPERNIVIECEKGTLQANLLNSTISLNGHIEAFLADRDGWYQTQLQYFFSNFENPHLMNNLFEASELFKKIVALK